MLHPKTGQVIFLGRSDGVLNPSGVRFGSAEIYSVIETHFPTVADSICIGQRRPQDQDETVMLFLLMRPGVPFTQKLVNEIKQTIREKRSPRHVPKYIFQTPEIPVGPPDYCLIQLNCFCMLTYEQTTVNLKKVELPVKQIVSGKRIKPSGTLLNPQCLEFYYQFAEVEKLVGPQSKL